MKLCSSLSADGVNHLFLRFYFTLAALLYPVSNFCSREDSGWFWKGKPVATVVLLGLIHPWCERENRYRRVTGDTKTEGGMQTVAEIAATVQRKTVFGNGNHFGLINMLLSMLCSWFSSAWCACQREAGNYLLQAEKLKQFVWRNENS